VGYDNILSQPSPVCIYFVILSESNGIFFMADYYPPWNIKAMFYPFINKHCEKVKVSCNRPRWPKGFRVGKDRRLYWRFSTTRVVGHQPNTPAAFTTGEIPGTHFQRLGLPQGTW